MRGPDYLMCSARQCEKDATGAIVWSNPKIHYGRTKTWLCCEDHRQFLTEYLAYREFPTRYEELSTFLAVQQSGEHEARLKGEQEQPGESGSSEGPDSSGES